MPAAKPAPVRAGSFKLKGAVERANRTHPRDSYQVAACSLEMKRLNGTVSVEKKSTALPRSSGPWLLNHAAVLATDLISEIGMKRLNNLLDKHMILTNEDGLSILRNRFPKPIAGINLCL